MTQLLLIATIAERRVALHSSTIQSVIEFETLTPVPRTSGHVAGLAALRSRMLTVIDCRCALGLAGSEVAPAKYTALVVENGGHFYALLVDAVEDVVEAASEPKPVHADIGAGWETVALGIIEAREQTFLLVDAIRFLAGTEEKRAA